MARDDFTTIRQDYALAGPGGQKAVDEGRASPAWWRPEVDRAEIRKLMEKDDRIAGCHALIWLGLLIGTGALAALLWPSWWSAPVWLAYGVLYCSASDARWHECGHRTASARAGKTRSSIRSRASC